MHRRVLTCRRGEGEAPLTAGCTRVPVCVVEPRKLPRTRSTEEGHLCLGWQAHPPKDATPS